MPFSSLGLSSFLLKSLKQQGFKSAFPIQEQAIPAILNKEDVLGIAKTGSGKTASYVLPILHNLEHNKATPNRHIPILVLVPTRELAIQVEEVFQQFSSFLPYMFKSLAVYGGVSINPQMIKMQNVNALVATPGRLLELIDNKAVHLDSVQTLVLDEADKMMNMGFKAEMDRIIQQLPKKRQNLLFSATLSPEIKDIERVLLHKPTVINILPEKEEEILIDQSAYLVEPEKKGPLLRYLIKNYKMQQVLVFVSSAYQADLVADKLRKNHISAKAMHGKRSQGARLEALNTFKSGKTRVLVATDLLARGIDIDFLPYVINYELPRSPKDFIHRIGRTGRAENPGEAITFVASEDMHHFKVILKKAKLWMSLTKADEMDLQGY